MNPSVLQARMEKLAWKIIRHLDAEGISPKTAVWETYRAAFFDHYWQTGYSLRYLTVLARYGVEDFLIRFYDAEKKIGPPAG